MRARRGYAALGRFRTREPRGQRACQCTGCSVCEREKPTGSCKRDSVRTVKQVGEDKEIRCCEKCARVWESPFGPTDDELKASERRSR